MSNLLMTIGEGLTVLVDYDYEPEESQSWTEPKVSESVTINAVCIYDINIMDNLDQKTIEEIEQKVFDSFDKELQEPDDEYVEG
jgi:outer membrane protease